MGTRPVISGPCGFVSDPYSTVVDESLNLVAGVGINKPETLVEFSSVSSSKKSSANGSGRSSNVLVLGNMLVTMLTLLLSCERPGSSKLVTMLTLFWQYVI